MIIRLSYVALDGVSGVFLCGRELIILFKMGKLGYLLSP